MNKVTGLVQDNGLYNSTGAIRGLCKRAIYWKYAVISRDIRKLSGDIRR